MRIGIVGCGPGGLATGLTLRRRGHDVTLLERFESPLPLGSGLILQPTGLAVLDALDRLHGVRSLGHRIDRLFGVSMPGASTALDVSYSALGSRLAGLAVHRAALFDVLHAAVLREGVVLRTGVDVTALSLRAGCIAAVDANGDDHGPFDLIVDASGAGSRLSRYALDPVRHRPLRYGAIWGTFDWTGPPFAPHTLEQRYVGAHTMIGVLPIGRHAAVQRDQVAFFWSLRSGEHEAWLTRGLAPWKAAVLSIWPDTGPILDQISTAEQMQLARYGHHTLRRPYGSRVAFVGDAAHATSPQLGQGANMALLDAMALGRALDEHDDVDRALRRYAAIRRWHVRLFQSASLLLTGFYQSDSHTLAWLRDRCFDPLSRLPVARRVVAGLISGMLLDPLKGAGLSRRKLEQGWSAD